MEEEEVGDTQNDSIGKIKKSNIVGLKEESQEMSGLDGALNLTTQNLPERGCKISSTLHKSCEFFLLKSDQLDFMNLKSI